MSRGPGKAGTVDYASQQLRGLSKLQRAILTMLYRVENGMDVTENNEAQESIEVFRRLHLSAGEAESDRSEMSRVMGAWLPIGKEDDYDVGVAWRGVKRRIYMPEYDRVQKAANGRELLGKYSRQSISRAMISLEARGLLRRAIGQLSAKDYEDLADYKDPDKRTVAVSLTIPGMVAGLMLEAAP